MVVKIRLADRGFRSSWSFFELSALSFEPISLPIGDEKKEWISKNLKRLIRLK